MCGGTIVQKTGVVGAGVMRVWVTDSFMGKRWHCVMRLSLAAAEVPENVWLVAISALRPGDPAY
ncbi:hypothetical protein GCM10010341_09290 [Streptomyces noursei]|nr:hypothetical protein GCM10010341_09290 [Streptomyces noursei]